MYTESNTGTLNGSARVGRDPRSLTRTPVVGERRRRLQWRLAPLLVASSVAIAAQGGSPQAEPNQTILAGWGTSSGNPGPTVRFLLPSDADRGVPTPLFEELKRGPMHVYKGALTGIGMVSNVVEGRAPCGPHIVVSLPFYVGVGDFFLASPSEIKFASGLWLYDQDEDLSAGLSGYFAALGFPVNIPRIERAVEADLDGDGKPEIIVEGNNLGRLDQPGRPGDFSVIAVGRRTNGAYSFADHVGYVYGISEDPFPARAALINVPRASASSRFDIAVGYEQDENIGVAIFSWETIGLKLKANAHCGL